MIYSLCEIAEQLKGKRCVEVIVKPNASQTAIESYDPTTNVLLVRISQPPDQNKANKELISFLSKTFSRRASIKHGSTNRRKLITLEL